MASPFLQPRPVADPSFRLIGFHHAGGSAAAYYPMARELPDDWDLRLLDLPGRGKRHAETPSADMTRVVAGAVEDVAPWLDAPILLFGHSYGAIVAVEVARELESLGRGPLWVGVSGRIPPSLHQYSRRHLAELDDDWLLQEMVELGGTPDRIGELPDLRERFLQTVRADLRAVDSYQPEPNRKPLSCPLTVFGGIYDSWAPTSWLGSWHYETTGVFRQRLFPGGHFYFMGKTFPAFTRELVKEVTGLLALAA
jgi:surfactin synthase thioesterase subunit